MKKLIFVLPFLFLTMLVASQEMKIEVDGNLTFDNSGFTISEAGNDFPSSIVSESSVFLSVVFNDYWDKKSNPNKKWKIGIYKSDLTWDSDLNIEVKRTGNGQKNGKNNNTNINDGENYQPISNISTYFFGGKDEIAYIPIDIKVSGFSITMGAQDYETSLVLTIYDD